MGGRQPATVAAAAVSAVVGSLALGAGVALGAPAKAITATEGVQFSGLVDQFSCPQGAPPQNISINWGDGTAASGGTGSVSNGSCTISGTHTYADEGSYATTVSYDSGV